MTRRVIVIGGEVTAADGDRHRVGAGRAAELYGLRPGQCWLARDVHDARVKLQGISHDRDDLVVLRPDPTGLYRLPLGFGLRPGCERDRLWTAAFAQAGQDLPWLVLADWCDDYSPDGEAAWLREWVATRHRLGVAGGVDYHWTRDEDGLVLERQWTVVAEPWRDGRMVMHAVQVADRSTRLHSSPSDIAPISCRSLTARPDRDWLWVVTAEYR